jgi:diguanylate cyclase (GGDEF)-like protein/PAS domain S-box-containing protein
MADLTGVVDHVTPTRVSAVQGLGTFRIYLTLTVVWSLGLLLLPQEARGAGYVLGAIGCLIALFRGSLRLQGPVRLPAILITLAGTASLLGVVVRTVYGLAVGRDFPFPSPGDVFTFLAYPLVLASILIVVRRRLGRFDLDLAIDALVAGIAAAIVQWSLIMVPFLSDPDFSGFAKATQVAYAAWGLAIFVAATMTLVAGGHRSTSNRMLAGALVVTFLVDNWGTYLTATGGDEGLILALAPLIYVFGGGLLHPSVVLLTSRPTEPSILRSLTVKRIAVMAAALIAPPALLVTFVVTQQDDRILLPALGSLALAPLVLVRLARLVQDRERLAGQEASLRAVGERLVAAESADDVARIITVGAEQVLGGSFRDGGVIIDPLSEAGRVAAGASAEQISALVNDADRQSTLKTGQLLPLQSDSAMTAYAGMVMVQRELRAVLVLTMNRPLLESEQLAIVALCREASIALRAVEQTELNVRQRSEERFAALVDNSSDIVAVLGSDGRLSYVSPVAVRLLGYPPDTADELDVLDLVHPEDRATAVGLLDDVRYGSREARELRLRHVTGTYHWFEVVGVDLESDPNIGGVVLNAREIGDRKAAEERLQLSEARFKALVQYSTDLVVVVDSHDGIRYVSPSVAATLGEDAEMLLGRSLDSVFRSSGVDWDTALRSASSGRAGHPELLEFGFRNVTGEWIHVEATVTDLRAEEAVAGFVLNARDVTERTNMMQRLRYQATHDDLTGLANRVLAAEELSAMLGRNAGGSTVAVISLDLDDFKDVNDSLGHRTGDRLLLAIAERIKESLAFGDVAARVGGDEFVVVLERSHGEDRVLEVAERLRSSLEQPFVVDERELSVTASAGVAYDHDRSTASEVLLRNADTAMYRAKQLGKRRVVVFETHMHTASFDRLELRADLARAIETDQFVAHYQPILDLETHRVIGAEALIRWQHPRRGLLSPAIFVPLAEDSGLIGQLGEWMLERACWDLAGWRRDLPDAAEDLTMSVNLSAQEVHSERLVPAVTDILHRCGLPADRLVLEVTESNLLTDTDVIQDRMQRLRSLGTRLAIDDFGTGYSSLGYIQRFAFDVLKIDRSFVEGLDRSTNRQIVTAVLDLARELGVRVVAEGIEEEAQERSLVELGCRYGQGFLYSRPVPAPEFRKLVVAGRTRVG